MSIARVERYPTADVRQKATKMNAPVMAGLEYLMIARGSIEAAAGNLRPRKGDGTVIGAPVSHPGFLQCRGLVSYIDTGVPEPLYGTYIVVARSLDTFAASATRPGFIGTFNGPSPDGSATSLGASLYANSRTALTGGVTRWDGSTTGSISSNNSAISNSTGIDLSKWNILSMRWDATTRQLAAHSTAFAPVQYANANPRYRTSNTVRIGSLVATYGGTCEVAAAAIFSRYITDAELGAMLTMIRAQIAIDGIIENA